MFSGIEPFEVQESAYEAPASAEITKRTGTSLAATDEAPVTAYAYSARGSTPGVLGAQGYTLSLSGHGQRSSVGGGVRVWYTPVERLTLLVDAPRDAYLQGHFAPSAAAIIHIFGKTNDGFSIANIVRYKVEGFGTDPNGDIETEIESGLLFSYVRSRLHLDLNTITGFGLTEEREIDTEGRLRFVYDVTPILRLGIDGQGRYRLSGTAKLINGGIYDFAGGPQLVIGSGRFFGAITAGPTTMGMITRNVVGATVMLTLSGTL